MLQLSFLELLQPKQGKTYRIANIPIRTPKPTAGPMGLEKDFDDVNLAEGRARTENKEGPIQ